MVDSLSPNVVASLSDPSFWISIGVALLVGECVLIGGVWIARRVGALGANAQDGEILGTGLGIGLLVLAAIWAAVASEGRSAFAPVAVLLAFGIARSTLRTAPHDPAAERTETSVAQKFVMYARPVSWRTMGGAVGFLFAVALLYGATLAPSPRDGAQPVEFMDEAYYSILGRDLAGSGTETIYSPSGFESLSGLPSQTWYHWGELWLAGAVVSVFDVDPMFARHIVVLPLLLLAAAALTGSFARRVTREHSTSVFVLGSVCCLFLAPVPFVDGPFSTWAVGFMFGVTLYGLAAVIVLLLLNLMLARPPIDGSAPRVLFYAACTASLVPSHIVIATLASVGAATGMVGFAAVRRAVGDRPRLSQSGRSLLIASGLAISVSVAWGLATGHGLGASGLSSSVAPFNSTWLLAIALTAFGAIALWAIPLAFFLSWRQEPVFASALVGTGSLLLFGAVIWGARVGDFNFFHAFFGAIAVFATPLAAASVGVIWMRFRLKRRSFALAALVICIIQLDLGMLTSVIRLRQFGPHLYDPVPTVVLIELSRLEPGAKVAYACRSLEEVSWWDSMLVSIDAHTERRVVPMCFQASPFLARTGGTESPSVMSPYFRDAPQLEIYPDSQAKPTPEVVVAFMKRHGIGYIYVDSAHPNNLVPDAVPISVSGSSQLLRVP